MTRRADVDLLAKVTARLGDAVVDPAIWPQIMEEICRAFATTGAVLLQSDVRTPDVPRTEAIDEVMKIYFDDDWGARDEIAKYGVPRLLAGEAITNQDLFTLEHMRRSPFYNDLIFAHGFQWFAGVGFWAGSSFWALAMHGLARDGPFGARDKQLLAQLAPRLTETATLSTAVGRAVLTGMTGILDQVRQPAAVLHRDGFVLGANAAAEAGFDDEIRVKDRRLFMRDQEAAKKVNEVCQLIRLSSDTAALPANPIVVHRTNKPPVLLRILPIDGAARNFFLGARALVILGNLTPPLTPELRVISQAFDLTPAEARLASLLVEGRSVNSIAQTLSVAPNTLRKQLKSIFVKTDTHRQGELIALLAQLTVR
jgi:DNA-binding CsgD family transcriptional regulator